MNFDLNYFTTEELVEIENLKKIHLVADYLELKNKEITEHNEKIGADKSVLINGINLTNFGVFRKY